MYTLEETCVFLVIAIDYSSNSFITQSVHFMLCLTNIWILLYLCNVFRVITWLLSETSATIIWLTLLVLLPFISESLFSRNSSYAYILFGIRWGWAHSNWYESRIRRWSFSYLLQHLIQRSFLTYAFVAKLSLHLNSYDRSFRNHLLRSIQNKNIVNRGNTTLLMCAKN